MKGRFFIVDDDPAVRRMLTGILSGMGRVVGESGSSTEALEMLSGVDVDVVLVDLLMPDMDGIELIRRLKPVCSAALVMISQVQAKEMVAEAYAAGIDFFIHKPINAIEVSAVIDRVFQVRRLQSTVNSIVQSVSELSSESAVRPQEQRSQRIRSILYDIGIGGESGAKDLEDAANYLLQTEQTNTFSLKELLMHLAGVEVAAQKASEQRMRRAVQSALRHLAALGAEDYTNPRFEQYAASFFDFAEVRAEMRNIQGHSTTGGKVSLKRFISALAHHAME